MRTRWKHTILARLQAELDELKLKHQFRLPGTTSGISLCSNDYLGLSEDPRLRKAVVRALEIGGDSMSSTGSRLLSGHATIWEELETKAASFAGSEASVYFSSGYMANVGLLSALPGPNSTVFSDSANHASIIDGIRLSRAHKVIFPHGDLHGLERMLRTTSVAGDRFVVVESIFSMDGDRAPLDDLYSLANRYDAGLIIDEAHATGVAGPGGRGLVAAGGRPDCVMATLHTCGKALASMGAFVACSETVRQYLINTARPFLFSTALAPYTAAQAIEALNIVPGEDGRRQQLWQSSGYLRNALCERGFDTGRSESHIVPVILGPNEEALRVAQSLVTAGFGVKAIRPPTVPAGAARLRLSLTSRHTIDQLGTLVQALCDVR